MAILPKSTWENGLSGAIVIAIVVIVWLIWLAVNIGSVLVGT